MSTQHGPEIEAFVEAARRGTGLFVGEFDVFSFGDSPEMADELVALVLAGRKRATAGLLQPYEAENRALPAAGGFSVVLDGKDAPVALIRTREVSIEAFRDVGEGFAREEGEGDLSLRYWREGTAISSPDTGRASRKTPRSSASGSSLCILNSDLHERSESLRKRKAAEEVRRLD